METDQPKANDGMRPKRAAEPAEVPVALGMATVGFYVAGIGVILVVLAADLHTSPEQLSWLGSAFGYGLIVMALAGPLLLRLGERQVLIGAAVALGLGSGLVALVTDGLAIGAGALLQGLGAAGVVLVAPRLLRGPDAATKLTRVNAVGSTVSVCAPLVLAGAQATRVGARPALLLIVAVAVVLIITARRIPVSPTPQVGGEQKSTASWPTVLRRWLALVCAVSVEFAFVVWGVTRLLATGLEAKWAALIGASFQVGMALGRVFGARLIARYPMVLIGAGLAAVGVAFVVLGTTWPLVGVGQLVAGLGVATLYPITLANLMATPGLQPSLGASLGALGSGVAITVAPTTLAGLAMLVDVQIAFLVPLPILLALVLLHRGSDSALR